MSTGVWVIRNSTWASFRMSRVCTKCKKTKDVSEFYKYRLEARSASACKVCMLSSNKTLQKKRTARSYINVPKEKQCTMCGLTRLSSEFSPNRGKLDGLKESCRGCNNDLRSARESQTVRGWLKGRYGRTPCTDCKKTYPWECMQFDHLDPATKTMTISQHKTYNKPTPKILKELTNEIAGCEIVCGNCHASRTVARATARQAERQAARDDYAASKITREPNEDQ